MRLKIILIGLLFASVCVNAQTGNYFVSNYTPDDERIDHITYSMAQNDRGEIYFTNKLGVLEFDGRNWTIAETPGPVYAISTIGSDVYVGGSTGYGKLTWSTENKRSYETLSKDQPSATQITSCLAKADVVYFLNELNLFIYSPSTEKTSVIPIAQGQSPFTALFEILGNVYVGTESNGLLKIDNDKLVPANFKLPKGQSIEFCSTLHGSNKVLLGSDSSRLFVFDDRGLREIPVVERSFLESNLMISGVWVSQDLIAIGTLRRGVIFLDPNNGTTKEILNYHTGLPDNEVYSMICDRNQGVWVAHDYGFTRIAPYLPFRSYSHYPGLAGNLLCATGFRGQLYAGTTLGLFVLVREELFEDESTFAPTDKVLPEKSPKGKKSFLAFLKKDKKAQAIKEKAKQKIAKRVLKSVQYRFKKIDGVDGKVLQLVVANGQLLSGGIGGVEVIEGEKSKPLLGEPVRTVFLSPSLNQLLVSTFNDEIKTFNFETKGGWKETHLIDTVRENINFIFEDKLQNVWLCGKSNIFKIEVVENEISEIKNVPLSNPSMDDPVGVAYGNEVYIAASGFFNLYDVAQGKFVKFNNNKLPGAKKYFSSAGFFWFYDGRRWRNVDENKQKAFKLEWLGLFQNIRYLAPTSNADGLWVITAGNELYNFNVNKVVSEQGKYPLFLREVRGQQSKIAPAKSMKVNQLESTVSFEFIQPDFLGMKAIEYRYLIKGLTKEWSPWSINNNIVNFSYLPTGKYKVEVQTRDLMTNTSETEQVDQEETVEIEVEPPYWKRSWFYAIEFAFFSCLVLISLKLGSGNPRYRYLSSLLSVLTVIMLIQFIQTVVASQISFKSTPVIDFFIQVFIALLVLPIEGYLRKFMIRSSVQAALPSRLWDEEKKK